MQWHCKDLGRSFSRESKYWSIISRFGQFYWLWKTFQLPQKNISVAWILKDDLWNKSPVFPDCTKVVPMTWRLQVLASKFDWLLWLSLPVVTGQANQRLRHFPALTAFSRAQYRNMCLTKALFLPTMFPCSMASPMSQAFTSLSSIPNLWAPK